MDNLPEVNQPVKSIESTKQHGKKNILIYLGLVVSLLVLLGIIYVLYHYFFTSFKTIVVLNYDAVHAESILKDQQSIAFTRDQNLYISDLKGDEIILASLSVKTLGEEYANFKISSGKKFILWQSKVGILGLNVNKKTVFLVSANVPRQAFDVSSISENILFLTPKQLLEISLGNGFTKKILQTLPQLEFKDAKFNNVKYSPDGKLAYIRTIHECCTKGQEDATVDLKTGKLTFLPKEFSHSVDLAPSWSADSKKLIAWRKGLVMYNISTGEIKNIIEPKDFSNQGPYFLNPKNEELISLIDKEGSLERPYLYNPQIVLANILNDNQKILFSNKKLPENEKSTGFVTVISDLGWLNESTIWFTVNHEITKKDLWVIDKNNGNSKKVLSDFDKYSLESVKMPIVGAYTLY